MSSGRRHFEAATIAKLSKAALARFVTAEGEPLENASAYYPFAPELTAEALRERLQAADALREQDDDEWTIVDRHAPPLPAPTEQPGAPSYLARARKILEATVGDLLGEPEIERRSVGELAN
jgi:hypothetical protein